MCSYNDAIAIRGEKENLAGCIWILVIVLPQTCTSLLQAPPGMCQRPGWAGPTPKLFCSATHEEAPLDPSPGSLCWECRKLKPSGKKFHSLQIHLCFTARKSSQTLINWPPPTQILIWDVCPHQVNVVNTDLLTSTWEMGGIGSQKCCFSKSQITRIFIL